MGFFDTQFALLETDVVGFTSEQRTAIEMGVYISIANEATWQYRNLKHPRYKNFYGYVQVMSGAFVVEDIALSFLNQEILHWRNESYATIDAVGCAAKLICSQLTPSKTVEWHNVKLRQRFTSVRFRLLPGVVANCSLVWETADSNCGNTPDEPNAKQGQPALPNNSGASGNPRPPGQGNDTIDPSNNDGNFNPNDGNPSPPSAGAGGGTGTWKCLVSAQDFSGHPYTATIDSLVADRFATVTVRTEPTGVGSNASGAIDRVLIFVVNGIDQRTRATGFGLSAFNPYYS